jgi:hypothetical protein
MLCGSLLVPSLALADIIKLEDMLHGVTMTPAQCNAITQAIWTRVDGQGYCVRYYLSTAGGEGSTPVVFLQGDRFGDLDVVTNSYLSDPETQKKGIDTDDLVRVADGFSRLTKTMRSISPGSELKAHPAIISLARPGLSST